MTSAIDRLRSLPEAFTFAAFRRLTGFSENAAAVCLHRWKRKHLIEPAGERTGIYFNKLKNPQPDTALRVEALLYDYPSAILCGESVASPEFSWYYITENSRSGMERSIWLSTPRLSRRMPWIICRAAARRRSVRWPSGTPLRSLRWRAIGL